MIKRARNKPTMLNIPVSRHNRVLHYAGLAFSSFFFKFSPDGEARLNEGPGTRKVSANMASPSFTLFGDVIFYMCLVIVLYVV